MRNGAHSKCTGSKRDMILFQRDTGARGPDALTMYDQYMTVKMPNLWEECLQPHHSSSPLAQKIPSGKVLSTRTIP